MSKNSLLRNACYLLAIFITTAGNAAVFNIPDGDVAALKTALTLANANGEADTINLAANGNYVLTAPDNSVNGPNGLPLVKNDTAGLDLTINGNGATIQRSAAAGTLVFRILQLDFEAALGCNDLTIKNGLLNSPTFPQDRGGGILVSNGTLTLTNCTVRGNNALLGGGIYSFGSEVAVNGCTFADNLANFGGGIYSVEGTLGGSNLTFSNNTAGGTATSPGAGGAVYNNAINVPTTLTLTGCNFLGNKIVGLPQGAGADL